LHSLKSVIRIIKSRRMRWAKYNQSDQVKGDVYKNINIQYYVFVFSLNGCETWFLTLGMDTERRYLRKGGLRRLSGLEKD
jgi:hypothetical protein